MIARIAHYRQLRRNMLPMHMALSMSGLRRYGATAFSWARFAIVAACCTYLLSTEANSYQSAADNRVAETVAQQAGEISEMRKIISACLGDTAGVLTIGDEIYFCRATSIGERK